MATKPRGTAGPKARKRVRYPPSLARPIPPLDLKGPTGLLQHELDDETRAHNEKVYEQYATEVFRRMELLKNYHGAGSWFQLAFLMAQQSVPGLEVAKAKAGRPKKDPFEAAFLKSEVDRMVQKSNGKLTRQQAFTKLAKTNRYGGRKATAIKSMYYGAPVWADRIVAMISAWDELVSKSIR